MKKICEYAHYCIQVTCLHKREGAFSLLWRLYWYV